MISKLVERICKWVAARRVCRPITRDDGAPYLDRYYLFGSEPKYFPEVVSTVLGWLPFMVFLHHFRDSDHDVELHNHPWDLSVSLVLTGGYTEERRSENLRPEHWNPAYEVRTREVRPGRLNVIRATDFHRVLLKGKDAWTIFVTGRKAQSWGFWHPKTGEFLPWREHLERRRTQAAIDALANAPGGRA